ncbi:hypothetical protein LTS72_07235 [Mycobacterium ostraviense]|uniref:Uncharacterized protein n=1 Tax=Mycobacterium ostraviense TaxID=2738409 RepID=A0A162EW88_9MYCO|nr:hypothetical protein [Mycobacterium ostraviense]KZS53651.1 hypothetical protein A4G28_03665 [Mycobacterium ostraviense]UGT93103.1 hypothetical protein LTS72_07235 [Mycobacterium ostraviense]
MDAALMTVSAKAAHAGCSVVVGGVVTGGVEGLVVTGGVVTGGVEGLVVTGGVVTGGVEGLVVTGVVAFGMHRSGLWPQ